MASPTDILADAREQLSNDRRTGPIHEVQLPLERITTHHGVMIDLDPRLYVPGNPLFLPADDPRIFYRNIKPVLERHPLARRAEVRLSGTGLHLLVWVSPPVELHSEAEQRRWDHIVRAVQCSLPADPDAPGITALTRAVGSVNSKNGATVTVLQSGEPVTPQEVENFVSRLGEAPFRELARVLLSADRVAPCPVCRKEGSRLDVQDRSGSCYGGCGRVRLDRLLEVIYAPPEAAPQNAPGKDTTPEATAPRKGRGGARTRS
jgi:hypothetical protein